MEKQLTEKESLHLITRMIGQAKNSYHDTGLSAMLWGGVVALCSLVKFAEIQFAFRLPFDIYLLTFVAIIPQIFISRKENKDRKVVTYDDTYMNYIWLAFGISIGLMIVVINIMGYNWRPVLEEYTKLNGGQRPGFRLYDYVAPLFLILYGLPTFITGAACKFRPMLWGGLLCWACCVITAFTGIKIDLLLVALSAVFAWLVPGIIMEKEYRKYKKELAAAHV